MNQTGVLKLLVSMAVTATAVFGTKCYADNPVVQTSFTADPAPMVYSNTVYLYTSHDEDDAPAGMARFLMLDWKCYTSTDMVNWTDRGTVASLKTFSWAVQENDAWAPQVIERNGKFYFYAPVSVPGWPKNVIAVAVADNPLGPFKDALGKPLIGKEAGFIDPTVFIDDDEQAYLYWGNPNLWYVKLNEDMISYQGEIIKDPLFAKVQGHPDPFGYQEGPWAYKRNGHYYMAYASTCCPEGMKSEPSSQGGMNVYPTRDGSYIKVKGVDFGAEGAGTFTASVACDTRPGASEGNAIELRLDRMAGPLIGTLSVSYSRGQWKKLTTPVTGATGTHDLFLVFKGEFPGEHFKADYWQFAKKTAR